MENKQIASALVKAKKSFNPALKDKTNPAYMWLMIKPKNYLFNGV